MGKHSISDGDLRLCQIYGAQSREFHAPDSWDECVERLKHGWVRIRGDCQLAWHDAEPHVRAAWHHAVAGIAEVRAAFVGHHLVDDASRGKR
jgi:hypothetical protein